MHQLFYAYGSNRQVRMPLGEYLIKWDAKSASKPQFAVKQFLKPYWRGDCVCEEFRIKPGKLRCDFLNITRRICIEFNGEQHSNFNPFFHNNSREKYRQSICRDFKKLEWLTKNNFSLVELIDEDLPKLSPEYILNKFGIEII